MDEPKPLISFDPQRRGGRACVRDLRISVGDVLGWLASGMTPEQVISRQSCLSASTNTSGFMISPNNV